MKVKKVICKLIGHKKGFLHKYDNCYQYVCHRCGDVVVEEIKYRVREVDRI